MQLRLSWQLDLGGGAAVAADLDSLKADVAKAQTAVKSAETDASWVCTPEAETYDMNQCAAAEDKVKAAKAELAKAQAALEAAQGQEQTDPAVEPQTPGAPEDSTKKEIKDKDLDTQYFCTETSIYYDHIKCEQVKAELKDAKIKDAELDIAWHCTYDEDVDAENTYYDPVKCAEAKDRLAKLKGEKKDQNAEEENPTAEPGSQPDKDKQADQQKQANQQKQAKSSLPVTGANGTALIIASLMTALAGAGVVAARRFKA